MTERAHVDLANKTAEGHDPVAGHGPSGDITAQGFRILDKGDTIIFTGRSHLLLKAAKPNAASAAPPALPARSRTPRGRGAARRRHADRRCRARAASSRANRPRAIARSPAAPRRQRPPAHARRDQFQGAARWRLNASAGDRAAADTRATDRRCRGRGRARIGFAARAVSAMPRVPVAGAARQNPGAAPMIGRSRSPPIPASSGSRTRRSTSPAAMPWRRAARPRSTPTR